MERGTDGDIRFFLPDGRSLPRVPEAPVLPASPFDVLRRQQPFVVDELPLWNGDRLDLSMAVDGFRAVHAMCGDVSAETTARDSGAHQLMRETEGAQQPVHRTPPIPTKAVSRSVESGQ